MQLPIVPVGSPDVQAHPVVADDRPELDVRTIPKPQRHPLIFARFGRLAPGESFVLVNSHEPKHLHDEFERDLPGAYDWSYLETGDNRLWRIRITRL